MTVETTTGIPLSSESLDRYLTKLVDLFFKILPIREKQEDSLVTYMKSLQIELVGFNSLVLAIRHDPYFITLLSILQYFIDNPNSEIADVRREVFRAISICNTLRKKYVTEVNG